MEHALLIGDTGGIGQVLRAELEARGTTVTGLWRTTGLNVTSEPGVEATLKPLNGLFDLIFVATGALTSGQRLKQLLRQLTPVSQHG